MKITCPLTIGKSVNKKCIDGIIDENRCPYYQSEENITSIDRLLDLSWSSVSLLGRYYNELQEDFWNIGQYMKSCIFYPGINSGIVEIKLYGKDGKYWTVEEVLDKYTNNYIEVNNEGSRKDEPGYT